MISQEGMDNSRHSRNIQSQQPQPQQPQQTIGIFYDKAEAEAAYDFLQAADFAPDQLSIQLEAPEPNQPVRETQAQSSAAGGAIVGTLFGCIVGFFIAVVTKDLPATSVSLQLNPLALALAGGAIGAFGFSLMGAALGVNVPKTMPDSDREPIYKHRVLLTGTDEDVLRAATVLRQHGVQV